MNINGSCHCGAITFEAVVNPDYVVICHCTDCQVFSSAPYRVTVFVKAENLRLSGVPRTYVKVTDSGNQRKQAFCGNCGTALYTVPVEDDPAVFNLRWGAIHQRRELIPNAQGFCRSRPAWAVNLEGIREIPAA